MARELLIERDLLLGSDRAKKLVGDVYKNIYVPHGAVIVKSAESDYIYCISKNNESIHNDRLAVSVTNEENTGASMMCFSDAIYLQRVDEHAVAIVLGELHVDGDVKEVRRALASFYITDPVFIELDTDEIPSNESESA